MKCPKCGMRMKRGKSFCDKCGYGLGEKNRNRQDEEYPSEKSDTPKWFWPMFGVVCLLIAGMTGVIIAGSTSSPEKEIAKGYKYLEIQEYEKAEDAFKEALNEDDKALHAYAGLAEAYTEQNKTEYAKAALRLGMDKIEEIPQEELVKQDDCIMIFDKAVDLYNQMGDTQRAEEAAQSRKQYDTLVADNEPPIQEPSGSEDDGESDKSGVRQEANTTDKDYEGHGVTSEPEDGNGVNPSGGEMDNAEENNQQDSSTVNDMHSTTSSSRTDFENYLKTTIVPEISVSQLNNSIFQIPEWNATSLEEKKEKLMEEFKLKRGVLSIEFTDMDEDGTEEMLIVTNEVTPEEEGDRTHELKVRVYKNNNGIVEELPGESIKYECAQTFPANGNGETLQCFLINKDNKNYLCMMNHKYGQLDVNEPISTRTIFEIYAVESGSIVKKDSFEEDNGDNIYRLYNNGSESLGTGKKVLYDHLSEYGFSCTWMDDYFETIGGDNSASGSSMDIGTVKRNNPFAESIKKLESLNATEITHIQSEIESFNDGIGQERVTVGDSTDFFNKKKDYGWVQDGSTLSVTPTPFAPVATAGIIVSPLKGRTE